ncbi:MAG TPA: hypothetical protein VFS52_22750 [Steroidobacteraceae bacterium]|jgi:hypothetical protein|nr:hypothetical protein [Steroidobacteraceae bacterium]
MSALMAALFKDHAAADQVRTALVTGGFPTDRVQLTSESEPGQAALVPAPNKSQQLENYFAQIFMGSNERDRVREFVDGVRHGNAALIVQPRGDIETRQAVEILSSSQPVQLYEQDLDKQTMEKAASEAESTVVGHLVPEGLKETINPRKN